MTDSEKIQNRADLLRAFADEPEGLVAHHDPFAGENLSNGTDEDDPSPLATVQAAKFLREVELTTGYHLDDRKHYVLELSALGEERGPITLGRYAVDAGFMAAANRRIVIGAPNSLVRDPWTDRWRRISLVVVTARNDHQVAGRGLINKPMRVIDSP